MGINTLIIQIGGICIVVLKLKKIMKINPIKNGAKQQTLLGSLREGLSILH